MIKKLSVDRRHWEVNAQNSSLQARYSLEAHEPRRLWSLTFRDTCAASVQQWSHSVGPLGVISQASASTDVKTGLQAFKPNWPHAALSSQKQLSKWVEFWRLSGVRKVRNLQEFQFFRWNCRIQMLYFQNLLCPSLFAQISLNWVWNDNKSWIALLLFFIYLESFIYFLLWTPMQINLP